MVFLVKKNQDKIYRVSQKNYPSEKGPKVVLSGFISSKPS